MRITCPACQWTVFEIMELCPNCGASLPAPEGTASVQQPSRSMDAARRILRACEGMRGMPKIHIAPDISEKRMRNAREHFGIPAEEEVFLLYDDTFFGSNKLGLAITSWGIRWKNIEQVPTRRQSLSWEELTRTPFKIDGHGLYFQKDVVVNMSGLGVALWRERFLEMLIQLGFVPSP